MTSAALSTLKLTVGAAFGMQVVSHDMPLAGAVAIPLQTEKFYDLTGSLTFLSCTFISLFHQPLRKLVPVASWSTLLLHPISTFSSMSQLKLLHPRQFVMSTFVILWSTRLGLFLADRAFKRGDSRFDEIKKSPSKFAGAWFMQGMWVSLTALPVFAVNAVPAALQPRLGVRDFVAAGLWVTAFAYEVIADRQKSQWRAQKDQKQHDEQFISSGLWAQSRHPNYVGEVSLWAAQYLGSTTTLTSSLIAGPVLPKWMWIAAATSPVLEYGLIRYISGVPMLEVRSTLSILDFSNKSTDKSFSRLIHLEKESGDKKYGSNPKWQEYKK
ncbi:hypothetical protein OIV83_005650 [Microbotryomycetes sp. JL201]|nr:hypothetical protein OIV83_005650 [Microbotryomycetes sp. JL201]